jgi:oxalate decarboxylase
MSNLHRRDFLTGAAGLAAAAAVLAARAAEAGDPSFMNNVPDPLLSGEELPTFKFSLEKSKGRVVGKSRAKEATAKQLPISKGIAGVSMGLEPGAIRELHWHATAAEWAYVDKGCVRTTVIDPRGNSETNDVEPGDVGYIPQGYGHSLENVGNKPSRVLIGFNSGVYEDIDLSEWMAANPPDVLATNFGKPVALFEKFPHKDAFITDKSVPEL